MLNPSLDVDTWINISYSTGSKDLSSSDSIDDELAEDFLKAIKKASKQSKSPKFDEDDFPFLQAKTTPTAISLIQKVIVKAPEK